MNTLQSKYQSSDLDGKFIIFNVPFVDDAAKLVVISTIGTAIARGEALSVDQFTDLLHKHPDAKGLGLSDAIYSMLKSGELQIDWVMNVQSSRVYSIVNMGQRLFDKLINANKKDIVDERSVEEA